MIDTIHVRIYRQDITDVAMQQLLSVMQIHKQSLDQVSGGIAYIGSFKNFAIGIFQKKLTINGSLAKYYLGNNVQTLTFEQTYIALHQLCKETGLPVLKGELARVDIAECFSIDSDINKCFLSLGNTPGYLRSIDPLKLSHGVRFTKEPVVLAFYNKTKDAYAVPEYKFNFSRQHVMRIELRITKNVKRTVFKRPTKFAAAYLLSRAFHQKLANLWCSHYMRICKEHTLRDPKSLIGWKEVCEYLSVLALHQKPIEDWLCWVQIQAEQNGWTTRDKANIKNRISTCYKSKVVTRQNRYSKELDEKVFAGYIFGLSCAFKHPTHPPL